MAEAWPGTPEQQWPGTQQAPPFPRPTLRHVQPTPDVSTEGAPESVRAVASFGLGEASDIYSKALTRYFKTPVEVYEGHDNRLEFIHPETDRRTFVNPPGPDIGDLSSFLGDATVLGPEALGGGLGLAGGPAGAIGGGALGAVVGEFVRLKIGQEYGVVDESLTEADLLSKAFFNTGLTSLAGGAAGTVVTKLAARLLAPGVVTGKKALRDLGESGAAALEEGVERARPVIEEAARITGREMQLTPSQVLPEAMKERAGALEGAVRGSDPMVATREGQREISKEAAQTVSEDAIPGGGDFVDEVVERAGTTTEVDEYVLGSAVQKVARERYDARIQTFAEIVTAAENRARAVTRLPVTTRPVQDVGGEIRGAFLDIQEALRQEFRAQYASIRSATGASLAVTMNATEGAGKKYKAALSRRVLKSASQLDEPIVRDILRAIRRARQKAAAKEFGVSRKEVKEAFTAKELNELFRDGVSLDFEDVQDLLSDLRATRRQLERGTPATVSAPKLKEISELIDAIEADRAKALADLDPDILVQVEAVEAAYREAKDKLGRSVVGDILKTTEGGRFLVQDSAVFRAAMKDPDAIKAVSSVLFESPKGAKGVAAIRAGLADAYEKEVVSPDTGLVDPKRHAKFVETYGEAVRTFFGGAELANLNKGARLTKIFLEKQKRAEALTRQFNKSFKAKLANMDSPEEIMNVVWKPRQSNLVKRLRSLLLREHPEVWRNFQRVVMKNLWLRVTGNGENPITAGALQTQLNNYAQAYREVFGQGFLNNLRSLRDIFRVVEMKGAAIASRAEVAGKLKDVEDAVRGIFFGPLTRAGYAVTKFTQIRARAVKRASQEIMSDAEKLNQFVKWARVKRTVDGLAAIVGAPTAVILMKNPELLERDEGETIEPNLGP